MEPCFPGDGWTPACPREVVTEFLVLLCLCAWLLLYLLNCLYLNPQVLSLSLFRFSPPSHCRGVSEWLCGAELPAGVKPRHKFAHRKVLCWVGPRWERAEWAELFVEKCYWSAIEGGQHFYGQRARRRGWRLLVLVPVQFMVWVWVNVVPSSTVPVIHLPV